MQGILTTDTKWVQMSPFKVAGLKLYTYTCTYDLRDNSHHRYQIGTHESFHGSGIEIANQEFHIFRELAATMQKIGESFDRHV